ncbi:MAG TPA: polysaccharide deacetylase family protein [Steroidobacteraceae bacterium]|nr:polysaccharide deacetylase family protein [Steroidobacteraceae bacterium]
MKQLSALERSLFSAAGSLLSPGGRRGSLLVLIYHRVFERRDQLLADEPDAATFAAHMDAVASTFNVLPLSEAAERLQRGALPSRAACITFDDGYANNLTVAAPILAQRELPATVFIATDFIGGGRMWNDTLIEVVRRATGELDLTSFGLARYPLTSHAERRSSLEAILGAIKYQEPAERLRTVERIAERAGIELPNDLMMSEAQIRALHAGGVEIGAHTQTHPILTRIDESAAAAEIRSSKRILEDIIAAPVRTFAYPNGRPQRDYARRDVALVKAAGFDAAVSTAWGCARASADVHQLPRIAPWDRTTLRFVGRMMRTYVEAAPQLA